MENCPSLPRCPFFNDALNDMPSVTGFLKTQYCKGEYESCARYLVSQVLGSNAVPKDMFPSENERAQKLIGKG